MVIEQIKKILQNHFKVPADLQTLARQAQADIVWGQSSITNEFDDDKPAYPGFELALELIKAWVSCLPFQIWVDTETEEVWNNLPLDVDPVVYYDIYFIDRRGICAYLWGKELSDYL